MVHMSCQFFESFAAMDGLMAASVKPYTASLRLGAAGAAHASARGTALGNPPTDGWLGTLSLEVERGAHREEGRVYAHRNNSN